MNNDFTVNNTQKVIKIPLKMNQNSVTLNICFRKYNKSIVDFSYTLMTYYDILCAFIFACRICLKRFFKHFRSLPKGGGGGGEGGQYPRKCN